MRALRTRNVGHRSVALWVVFGYLLVTLIPAWEAAEVGSGKAISILLLHVTSCAIVALLAIGDRSKPDRPWIWRLLRDWTPLAAVPALYAELPDLISGVGSRLHDELVQRWEAALFGASPAHVAAGRWPWTALSELLHVGYLSYYAIIYVPPLWLYLRNERRAFEVTITALAITFTACFTVFVFFPVAGPRYLWSAPPGIPDGPVRRLALMILAAGSSKGAAFPSSHVAVAVVQSILMLHHHRRAGLLISGASLLLALGAVYGGFHYGIDVLVGGATGAVIASAVALRSRAAHAAETDRSTPAVPQAVVADRASR